MTSDPIRLGNFFSSFDTEAVISQLTQARSVPILKIASQQTELKAKQAALGSLQASFGQLLAAASNLSTVTSVSGRTAAVVGSGVSAAAGPNAPVGSFTVSVSKVATGTQVAGPALSAGANSAAFLNAANLGTAVTAGTFTVATATGGQHTFTVDPATESLDDVLAAINASGIGVTATLANDANGRPNVVQLASTEGAITLGTGADTSNFLGALNLLASPGTTSRQSTAGIARLDPAATLSSETWQGGTPAAGAHTLTINGVSIAYDSSRDSLNAVLNRITNSAAGVVATYDRLSDTVRLQAKGTGSVAIALADDGAGGDFLAKTGLLAAIQTLGSNAEYAIDSGPTQYAATNTVAYNGVTLTLGAATVSPATVSVGQDAGAAVSAVNGFITAFNNVLAAIGQATTANGKDTSQSGPLVGDASVLALASRLRTLVTSAGTNLASSFTTLGAIGVSFGPVGSAVGSTNALQLDETKFRAALANDPGSVQAVLSQYSLSASLLPGSGSITGVSGQYAGERAGTYAISDDGNGNLTAVFTPADGSATVTTTATVAPGGTNTTLVPGVTLQLGALAAGTQTIAVTATTANVVSQIKDFLQGEVGADGTLARRLASYDTRLRDMDAQKERVQASVDAEMAVLRKKFIAMEQAQARAQSVLQSLQQAMNSMNASKN